MNRLRTTHALAGCIAAAALALAFMPLGCTPESPARSPNRCPEVWDSPCLTTGVCMYDAAHDCFVCRCGPPPYVPFNVDVQASKGNPPAAPNHAPPARAAR